MEHVSKYVTKLGLVRRYMFYCAFENSVFPDYVTEKFYHGLRMGAVPIVVGAPNVGDFAPSPNSFLRIGSLEDIPAVVEKMKEAMRNRTYYEVGCNLYAPFLAHLFRYE